MTYTGDFHAYKIYAEQLFPLGHGHPLWEPEPTRFGEVQIGDVGYMRGGAFHRLFNALRPADDPANVEFGCPGGEDYRPLRVSDYLWRERRHAIPSGPLYSKSMKEMSADAQVSSPAVGGGLSFHYTGGKGAVLLLYDSATRMELHDSRLMQEYMHRHYESWCNFAMHNLDLVLDRSEIVFVQGWVKTTKWAVAAFAHGGRSGALSFSANPALPASASLSVSVSSDVSISKQFRVGPIPDSPTGSHLLIEEAESSSRTSPIDDVKRDQCVFLQYCKLRRRLWRARVIKAAAEPKTFPGPHEDGADSHVAVDSGSEEFDLMDIEHVPSRPQTRDPLDDVLDYILDNSNADVAVAGHADIAALCERNGVHMPEDLPTLLDKVKPTITISAHGLGTLSLSQGDNSSSIIEAETVPADVLNDSDLRDAMELWEEESPEFDDYVTSSTDISPLYDFLSTPAGSSVDDLLTSPLIAIEDFDFSPYADRPLFGDAGLGIPDAGNFKQSPKYIPASERAGPLLNFDSLYTMSSPDDLTPDSEPSDSHSPAPQLHPRTRQTAQRTITAESLVPIDAPVQSRKYITLSAASRKEIPTTFTAKRVRFEAFGAEPVAGSSTALDPDALTIEERRRRNTLAAGLIRKRRLEYQQQLEAQLQQARADAESSKTEAESWKSRALKLEALLQSHGHEIPTFEPPTHQ